MGPASWHSDDSTEAGRRRRLGMRGLRSYLKPPEDMRVER